MFKKIISKIKNKKVTVGIIGLGYVGLPLAFRFLNKKINVIGIDIDYEKINKIKKGISYIENKKFVKNKYYEKFQKSASSKYENIANVDIIIICLPTPLNKAKIPDLSLLKGCLKKIKKYIKDHHSLILESTVYPGATIELFNLINKDKRFVFRKKLLFDFFTRA